LARRGIDTAHPSHYLLYYYILLDRDHPDTSSLLKGPPPPRSIFISKNTSAEKVAQREEQHMGRDHIILLVILR
jgi:hypothetical protein